MLFIGLDGPKLSEARFAQRVAQGGLDVPSDKLVAHFPRTLANARAALDLADAGWIFDNGDPDQTYRLALVTREGAVLERRPPIPGWCEPG